MTPRIDIDHGGRRHSSFDLPTLLLPVATRMEVRTLYQLCRDMDDLIDRRGDARSAARLAGIEKELRDGRSADPLTQRFHAIRAWSSKACIALADLASAVRSDAGEVRMADEQAVLDYAYGVAGTVGLMMCELLGVEDEGDIRDGVDLGIAMQLTNIARDVEEDALLHRRYVPADWLPFEPDRILRARGEDRRRIMEARLALLDLADDYYQRGWHGIANLPMRQRLVVGLAAAMYRDIGTELRNRRSALPILQHTRLPMLMIGATFDILRPSRRRRPVAP